MMMAGDGVGGVEVTMKTMMMMKNSGDVWTVRNKATVKTWYTHKIMLQSLLLTFHSIINDTDCQCHHWNHKMQSQPVTA